MTEEMSETGRPLYAGTCVGGPWDGRAGESRYPKGFLLIDRPNRKCWIYERRADGGFYVRPDGPEPLLEEGPKNRFRAAEESEFDIRVVE